ncbi:type IV pilin protein [Noviherbaspirillum sp.]|uniref:type IV pilin protein n=1 Tax=Noviherbaspirillum sp. TaxID=1926288 RepID=UPI002FE3E2EB
MHHSKNGFTLIEMMITVAAIAILASIAIPAYRDYITRGRIPTAHTNLAALRANLEQYFTDNRTYVGACAPNTVAPLPNPNNFTFSCPTLTATTFEARATGIAGGPMDGFVYSINQDNEMRTTSVPAGWGNPPFACWVTKKGQTC